MGMRISYINNFDSYNPTVSSENSNYPGINVQDGRLTKVWRTTALTSATITIDSGTGGLTPTFAALLNTNLSTGATAKIQGSSSSGFGSSTELSLTRVSSGFIGSFLSLSAKRYWRFLIKDTGSTDSYMQAGRAWLGTYINIQSGFTNEFPENHIDSSQYSVSYSGQVYGDAGIIRRGYNLKFPYLTTTGKAAIETFFSAVKKANKFITVFDSTNLTKIKPLYGFKTKDNAFKHIYGHQWECNFDIEEAK